MGMRFHGNQLSRAIKHPFNSLCFKYHSSGFICFSALLAPVISSLDEIYCNYIRYYLHLIKDQGRVVEESSYRVHAITTTR